VSRENDVRLAEQEIFSLLLFRIKKNLNSGPEPSGFFPLRTPEYRPERFCAEVAVVTKKHAHSTVPSLTLTSTIRSSLSTTPFDGGCLRWALRCKRTFERLASVDSAAYTETEYAIQEPASC
jgi:hypothetical protein